MDDTTVVTNQFMRIVRVIVALAALGILVFSLWDGECPLHPAALAYPWRTVIVLALGFYIAWSRSLARMRTTLHTGVFDSSWSLFNVVLFAVSTLTFALTAHVVFDAIPRLDDSVAAVFQSRLLLQGDITLPLPEQQKFFRVFGVLGLREGVDRWCGMYPPAWPVLLMPGVAIGAPWIINPILGGLLAVSISMLGRELFTDRLGRIAGLLCVLSPFVTIICGTHLSHTPTALFCTLCMWAVLRLLNSGKWPYGLVAGFCWGTAFLCRPLTALIIGVCIALIPLYHWRKAFANVRGVLAALLLASMAAGTQAAWQHATTGDARTPGHVLGMGRRGKMGFVRLDHARTHTPAIGIDHTQKRLRALNSHLHGWPWPSLLLALVPFLACKARKEEAWLVIPALALGGTFSAFWYYESYFPARYYFASIPFLLLLSARGFELLEAFAARGRARVRAVPMALVLGGTCFTLFISNPDYMAEHDDHFGDVEPVLPRVMRDYDIHNAVVFIDAVGKVLIRGDRENDFYASGFRLNDIDLQGDIVYARNLRERNIRLMDAYPGRRYYAYRYDRVTRMATLYEMHRTEDLFEVTPIRPHTPDLTVVPVP